MKREFPPIYLTLFLILGGVFFSLISSRITSYTLGFSPLMAIAYIGGMYLPRRWGWSVGLAVALITNLAYLKRNYLVTGSSLSPDLLATLGVYVIAAGLGLLIARNKSLWRIIAGSLTCSLLFYVATNTASWWVYQASDGYAPTLAGWWQANTVGMAEYSSTPTWLFLRNGMAGDLLFTMALLLALDRSLIFGRSASMMTNARPASESFR